MTAQLHLTTQVLNIQGLVTRPGRLKVDPTLQSDKPLTVLMKALCLGCGYRGLVERHPTLLPAHGGRGCYADETPRLDDRNAFGWATFYPGMPWTMWWDFDYEGLELAYLSSFHEDERAGSFTLRVRSELTLRALLGTKGALLAEAPVEEAAMITLLVIAENEVRSVTGA